MKNIYSIIVVVLVSFLNLVANAQISDDELGEFTNKEDYLRDFEKLRMVDSECCGELPNLTFFYSPFSTKTNHDLIMEARIRAHHAWFNRQYEGFKKEIEKQLKKTYPNFEQAQKEFYKHVEKRNVLNNHGVVESKYKKKVKTREALKDASLRKLKLLELRKKELIIGNINNTNYSSFNYNGTPIGDIKSMSQLNTLKEQEISTFGANEWRLQDDDDVYRYLRSDLSQMWNYDNANNYDYPILRKLSELQMSYFNSYGSWEQLDLMQMYLNNVRLPLVMVHPIIAGDYGTAQFIENYVVRLRSGGESIFDPQYFDYLFDHYSEDYYAEAYAANGGGLTEEELEEVTENIIKEIEEIVTDERDDYINDLLGDISGDDFVWTTETILFVNPGQEITDIDKHLECFNVSQGAILTIYVDQPVANSSDTWAGSASSPEVGHTFISISQNGVTRTLGFYPDGGIKPKVSNDAIGILVDDSEHPFDVSASRSISAGQLTSLLTSIESYGIDYNLEHNNCSDFGLFMVNQRGFNFPDTSGSWPGGSGTNPGNLGQDLRSDTTKGTNINKTGGKAPKNSGTCP